MHGIAILYAALSNKVGAWGMYLACSQFLFSFFFAHVIKEFVDIIVRLPLGTV